jgi:hypothetical protein
MLRQTHCHNKKTALESGNFTRAKNKKYHTEILAEKGEKVNG